MSEQMTRQQALQLAARTEQRIKQVDRLVNEIDRTLRQHQRDQAAAGDVLVRRVSRLESISNRGWRGRWAWLLRGK